MPRYHFHLRDGAAGVTDLEGTNLPGPAAARAYAAQVARELMARAEVKRRHWRLDVSDDTGKVLFNVPFAEVDITINHLCPTTRGLVERLCRNTRELAEAVFEGRLAVLKSKAIRARSNGKPYLAAHVGRQI